MSDLNMQEPGGEEEMSFARLMSVSMTARLFVDTSFQIFSPFLSIFALGLNTNVVNLGRLISLRSAMGLLAPLFGSIADRSGYRRVLRFSLWIGALGLLLIGLSNNLWMAALGMALSGIGMTGFTPTLQAYISGRLPYSRRARGLGMLEYSWALTGIFGLFFMGWLIEAVGWRAPFLLLAAGMAIMGFVFGLLPSARHDAQRAADERSTGVQRSAVDAPWPQRVAGFFRLQSNARSAYANMVMGTLNFFAGMQLMITYGVWLASEYGLGAAQLGAVAVVFGLFDLIGSVAVSLFTDRIGKRRSVLMGISATLVGYLLLPALNQGLVMAVLAIAVTRGSFEFSIVSNFSLLSEQVPEQRGKVMSLSAAFGLSGATIAVLTGPWLYTNYGVVGFASISAVAAVGALIILITLVREPAGLTK